MADLKDKNGSPLYPNTKTANVYDSSGNSLDDILDGIGSAGGSWQESEIATHKSGGFIYHYTQRSRYWSSNDPDCTVYVADVVEYEKLKIHASCKTGTYGEFVFVDKEGFTIGTAPSNGYSTAVKEFEVEAPAGAVKVYISEYTSQNGSGSTKLFRNNLEGQAKACYRESVAHGVQISASELQKYYDLGAQKMDTYNLVREKVGIITIGQSNADGRLPAADFPATANINGVDISLSKSIPTCKIMKGSSDVNNPDYDYSASQFSAYNNTGAWAFDQVVYNAIANALGETDFFVCKQTAGATSLQDQYNRSFWPDIDQFKNSGWISMLYRLKCVIRRAMELQPDLKFKAILMHQGEADSVISKTEGAYYIGLCCMIQWIRGLVGSPNLPFIFGSIPTNSTAFSQIIYNDMVRCAADMDNVYMVDMGEASGWHNDGIQQHFSAADAVKLADGMYKLMVSRKMLAPYV